MEFASYLAGEPWSDHPDCTHPALATLARDVNDYTSDNGRHRLVPLIPSVVGLNRDDPQLDVDIALRAATAALPIAAEERQRVLAVGILRCHAERPTLSDDIGRASRQALDAAPLATAWARNFVRTSSWNRRRRPFSGIIHHAIRSVAEACISNADDILHRLLQDSIDDCQRRIAPKAADRPASHSASA
ncbi:MAG TPA: hypothetical protein VEX15_07130 [Nocardioidaceae bacterium]|nr:hypothetical protein [Nocardioidaceae bacterium]